MVGSHRMYHFSFLISNYVEQCNIAHFRKFRCTLPKIYRLANNILYNAKSFKIFRQYGLDAGLKNSMDWMQALKTLPSNINHIYYTILVAELNFTNTSCSDSAVKNILIIWNKTRRHDPCYLG